jgi:hypothetical protein
MSRLLGVNEEWKLDILLTLDNVMVAKWLLDHKKPIDPDWYLRKDSNGRVVGDEMLYEAVKALFEGKIDERRNGILIAQTLTSDEVAAFNLQFIDSEQFYCEYWDIQLEMEASTHGIAIRSEEYYGMAHTLLDALWKLAEWLKSIEKIEGGQEFGESFKIA